MTDNLETCPGCGEPEVDAMVPYTIYRCGSSIYDGRPGTFRRTELCKKNRPEQKRQGELD